MITRMNRNKFGINWPLGTHWRPATCDEVECKHWREGWSSEVPTGSIQENYIFGLSDRDYRIVEATKEGHTRFIFPPGQKCFDASKHFTKLDRQPLFIKDQGGNRKSQEPNQWVDEFQADLEKIRTDRGEANNGKGIRHSRNSISG